MAVIDAEYYLNVFGGTPAADEKELSALLNRAEMQIETMIGRSVLGDFSRFEQTQLRRAAAFQTEYLIAQGGLPSAALGAAGGDGCSLGSFRQNGSGRKVSVISPSALACLSAAGLLYRGLAR